MRLSVGPCARARQGVAWQRRRRLGKGRVTANLDRPCARRRRSRTGRDEGTASGANKGTVQEKESYR